MDGGVPRATRPEAAAEDARAAVFREHHSFDACYCDVSDADHLLHHLVRLEQAYRSRLPTQLAHDVSLSFGLQLGGAAARERIANLFDATWRRQRLPPDVAKAVFRALAGPNPQGCCWKGWRKSGFGETQASALTLLMFFSPFRALRQRASDTPH